MRIAPSVQTLCFIHEPPRLLLGRKKRGFGAGKWNGFGGKIKEGESVEDCAWREFLEEAGIEILGMEKAGVLAFEFEDGSTPIEGHLFRVTGYRGEPRESEEMLPRWFATDALPFGEMWPDDPYWMPLLLSRKRFEGRFLFGADGAIVSHDLRED